MKYNKDVVTYTAISPLTNIPKTLIYRVSDDNQSELVEIGKLVFVLINNRCYPAFVIDIIKSLPEEMKDIEIQNIQQISSFPPFFDKKLLEFYNFAASYYNVPLGMVLKSAFPNLGGVKIEEKIDKTKVDKDFEKYLKKLLPNMTPEEIKRLKEAGIIDTTTEIKLKNANGSTINYIDVVEKRTFSFTEEQLNIKEKILSTLGSGVKHILFGKTGSGKTELLLEIAKEIIDSGKSVLYMVPEISLAPHIYKRAASLIKSEQIFVWHSSINNNHRWQALIRMNNQPSLMIGTRSAIFLPFKSIGLIVVDEEHDGSYKHDGQFPYNARDMAIMRGKMLSHPVVLASATPSVETYYSAEKENVLLHKLSRRFSPKKIETIIVDTKEEKMINGFFSNKLVSALEENLAAGLQSMIFINRRGYIPYIYCEYCKKFVECDHCTVPLTWHRKKNLLRCHHCDKNYKAINVCPYCKNPNLSFYGAGTERIKEILEKIYPEANILKIDRDDLESKSFFKRHLTSILDGTYNIIVATQIMAKGHHMPNLTLVGVLLGEQGLSMPDFRAQERSFQILSQVLGRAGREKEGKVIIQTGFPDAPSINFAIKDDYESFYQYEIESRKAAVFPPFVRLLVIKILSRNEQDAAKLAEEIYNKAKESDKKKIICYPPQVAPIYKESGWYKYQIYVKSEKYQQIVTLVRMLKSAFKRREKVRIYYDIDPYNIM